MDSYKRNAIIVGLLFISATVASILSSVFSGSALTDPVSLAAVKANESGLLVAAILQIIAALSAFGVSVAIYPIIKRYFEGLAISYVGLRIFENTFYILGVIGLLILLVLSQDSTGVIQPVINSVMALRDWSLAIGTVIIVGVGTLVLNYVFYHSKLVPRWLSVWGFIGGIFLLLYGLLNMINLQVELNSILTFLAAPIAVQEMVLAVWLIVKGYNPEAIASAD